MRSSKHFYPTIKILRHFERNLKFNSAPSKMKD